MFWHQLLRNQLQYTQVVFGYRNMVFAKYDDQSEPRRQLPGLTMFLLISFRDEQREHAVVVLITSINVFKEKEGKLCEHRQCSIQKWPPILEISSPTVITLWQVSIAEQFNIII